MESPQNIQNRAAVLYDPVTLLLSIQRKQKQEFERIMPARMFSEAFVLIAKIWKRRKHPSTDEWTGKRGTHRQENIIRQ